MDGWVYVLSNKSMPGLVKIGFSLKDPQLRASELFQTGTPFPFKIEYSGIFKEPRDVEQKAHKILTKHRVNESREFFSCPPEEAIFVIEKISSPIAITHPYSSPKRIEALKLREKWLADLKSWKEKTIKDATPWHYERIKKASDALIAHSTPNKVPHFWGWLIVGAVCAEAIVPHATDLQFILTHLLFSVPGFLFSTHAHSRSLENNDYHKKLIKIKNAELDDLQKTMEAIDKKYDEALLSIEKDFIKLMSNLYT